jgi:hypothetical protein
MAYGGPAVVQAGVGLAPGRPCYVARSPAARISAESAQRTLPAVSAWYEMAPVPDSVSCAWAMGYEWPFDVE